MIKAAWFILAQMVEGEDEPAELGSKGDQMQDK
jgi:hypothetical protein